MTTIERTASQLSWRFALAVVAVSFIAAGVVRWVIVTVAPVAGDRALLVSAFALVIAFMIAVGGVGFGMRNRQRGGRFTLIFALVLAAVHVVSGLSQGISILAVPFDPYSTDFSAFLLVPLLYTVPAVSLRLVRWWWIAIVLAAGIAVSNVALALSGLA